MKTVDLLTEVLRIRPLNERRVFIAQNFRQAAKTVGSASKELDKTLEMLTGVVQAGEPGEKLPLAAQDWIEELMPAAQVLRGFDAKRFVADLDAANVDDTFARRKR